MFCILNQTIIENRLVPFKLIRIVYFLGFMHCIQSDNKQMLHSLECERKLTLEQHSNSHYRILNN